MAKKILTDYKKIKNTLISPMNQIANIKRTNWEDNIMPELIWIALLIKNNGFSRATAEIIEKMSKFIQENFATQKILSCSDFYHMDIEMKKNFLEIFSPTDIQILTLSFENFVYFFPDFPLSFLVQKEIGKEYNHSLIPIKELMHEFIDKRSVLSTQVLAMAIYSLSLQGKLYFGANLAPNLEAIRDYPNTDESRQSAASLRSMSFILVFNEDKQKNWCDIFWDRSCKLDECE